MSVLRQSRRWVRKGVTPDDLGVQSVSAGGRESVKMVKYLI